MTKFLPPKQIFLLLSIFTACQPAFKFSGNNSSLNIDSANSSLTLAQSISNFDGTLKLKTATANNIKSTTSETISFANGSVQTSVNNIDIASGSYDPKNSATDEITLNNGNILSVSAGSTVEHIIKIGGSNSIGTIIGTPTFSSAITLHADGTSQLNIGIQHKLNKNITFGAAGGTVKLTDDLALQDGVKFVPSGTSVVDLDFNSLRMGKTDSTNPWTGALTFKNAQDIQLDGPTAITGTGNWIFANVNPGEISTLNGNGNVLDLSGGGKITVNSNHTLYINDVHIKGLGIGDGQLDPADHATTPGTIILSNVTLDLSGNYLHDTGSIKIRGGNCRMIVGNSTGIGAPYTFTVDVNASLLSTVISMFEVDGQAMIYEPLGGNNTNPFLKDVGAGPIAITSAADYTTTAGVIRSAINQVASIDTVVDAVLNNLGTVTLTENYDLFTNISSPGNPPTKRISITNSASPTAKTVTIHGGDLTWTFPNNSDDVLKIAADTTVILENVRLKNFSLENVEFVNSSTSFLQIGNNVIIDLDRDLTFPAAGKNLFFSGNGSFIYGHGHSITTTANQGILIESNASVTLDQVILKIQHATGVACLGLSSIFNLANSKIEINQSGFSFNNGSIRTQGFCEISANITNAMGGIANFDFSTPGTLTLFPTSVLKINNGINFRYMPDPVNNLLTPNPTELARQHLSMQHHSAILHLNGCTFTSTTTPVRFTNGHLIVENKVQLTADNTTTGLEAEIGSAVSLQVLAASSLNINGSVKYIST